jgi:lysozyme
MSKVVKRAGLAGLVGAGAAAILLVIVPKHEGTVLKGYLDPVGIPTKCMGDTSDVVVAKRYTAQECQESLERQLYAHAAPVLACTPQIKGNDHITAASVSLAYNIGTAAYCKSSIAAKFRAGDFRGGCAGFSAWTYAGGKQWPGLVKRRAEERAVCEAGL